MSLPFVVGIGGFVNFTWGLLNKFHNMINSYCIRDGINDGLLLYFSNRCLSVLRLLMFEG